jgi:hypothetical protein
MSEVTMCPVCEREAASTESTVDVYSDTTIECCNSCRELLTQAKKHQFCHTATRSWLDENKTYLDRAVNALQAEYERMYGAKDGE